LMNEWIGHESVLTMGPPTERGEHPELEADSGSTDDA